MYSAFCGEMASRGYIVCAIEHRDGTSPSSKITSADGTTQVLDWLQWSDLQWPDELIQPTNDTRLRHEQLKLRAAEISACVAIMTRVATGEKPASSLTAPDFDWSRWTVLDTSRPVMAGHSLGGSAALVVSASHGAVDEEGSIKWRAVLVMDPATQRIAPWASELPHPLLVLCSEEFAVGDEYAIFAEQVAGTVSAGRPSPHTLQPQKAKGPFGALNQPGPDDDGAPLVFSIPGATHPSFSDVFLILPESVNRMTGLRVAASTVVSLTINACADFLNGKAEAIEKRSVVYRPKKVKEIPVIDASVADGEPEKVADVPRPYKPVGKAGDLVWHQFERDEQGQ
jgi:platelet-activating factor acetylhydrolase